MAKPARFWHGRQMANRPRAAGGFFLIAPIVAGFFYGLADGRAVGWTFIGLVVGIALATIVWLVDRRR